VPIDTNFEKVMQILESINLNCGNFCLKFKAIFENINFELLLVKKLENNFASFESLETNLSSLLRLATYYMLHFELISFCTCM